MVKFFLTWGLEIIVGLTILTQVVIPVLVKDLPLFWLFRPSKPKTTVNVETLDALDKEVDDSVERMKVTKEKVDAVAGKVDDIKSKI